MSKITNVALAFPCTEKPGKDLACAKCARRLTDFRNETPEHLQAQLQSASVPVCGVFSRTQLKNRFSTFAGATVLAALALAVPGCSQDVITPDRRSPVPDTISEKEEDLFFGLILEVPAQPVGGYEKFYDALMREMEVPNNVKERRRLFVSFMIDSTGRMTDIKVMKGDDEHVNQEVVRALIYLDYPFYPGTQRNKPVPMRMVLPVSIEPRKK